jgi:hypothetical protein
LHLAQPTCVKACDMKLFQRLFNMKFIMK